MEEQDLSKVSIEEPEKEDSPIAENLEAEGEMPPAEDSPEWSDYVLRQFEQDEIDQKGNPSTAGLRRVAQKLLGEIVYSVPRTVQSPNVLNDFHAVIEYEIRFMQNGGAYLRTFGEVADVHITNTDPEYAKYASATASTRAEGRALRKALKLKKVIASEEASASELQMPEKITPGQINFIDMMCQKNNINVMKLLNSSKRNKFTRIEDVPYGTAVQINKYLSECQSKKRTINEDFVGYDSKWRQ